MNIGILKILDFQARAKRRRDELWYKLHLAAKNLSDILLHNIRF
jgi:hypothetical protein